MTAPNVPCEPWVTSDDVAQGECAPDVGEFPESVLSDAAQAASAWLYRLSGRVYGGSCLASVRPLWRCQGGSWSWVQYDATDGRLLAWRGPYGPPWNRAEAPHELTLGWYPVNSVLAVTVDGVPLDASTYRLDDNRRLVRLHGDTWNYPQDLSKNPGETGTWTVDLVHGIDPPPDGRLAARVLACEVAHWLRGDACRIPKRATNIARQGVSVALIDPSGLLENGRFGIPEVDAFLNTVNPHRLARRPGITNVDIGRRVRATESAPGS